MTNEVKRGCPWWRALTKMVFGTQRHRETGNPRYFFFIFYVYAHPVADILESVRVHVILYLNNDLLFTVQLSERIPFRLIPRSNSRYSVCAKTCPIWNSLRCGLYANVHRETKKYTYIYISIYTYTFDACGDDRITVVARRDEETRG